MRLLMIVTVVVLYGPGASLLTTGDNCVSADLQCKIMVLSCVFRAKTSATSFIITVIWIFSVLNSCVRLFRQLAVKNADSVWRAGLIRKSTVISLRMVGSERACGCNAASLCFKAFCLDLTVCCLQNELH